MIALENGFEETKKVIYVSYNTGHESYVYYELWKPTFPIGASAKD